MVVLWFIESWWRIYVSTHMTNIGSGCRMTLHGAKPLPKPILANCVIWVKYKMILSKRLWKCRLQNVSYFSGHNMLAWWRHQMETFPALLAICAGNSPVPGEFPTQRPVRRNFDVFFDLRPNKRLSEQSWGWWFETPLRPLWRHRNGFIN